MADATQNHYTRALMALLFTTLTWGVTPVFVRAFSLAAGPLDALIIRTSAVALVFAIMMLPSCGFGIAARDWPRLLFVSLVGYLGYFGFSIYGFADAPAGVGTLITSTQPLIIAVLARFAGTERLTVTTIIGLFVSFAGSVLLVSGDDLATSTSTTSQVIFGCVLIFIAGICLSIFIVFSRPLIQNYGSLKITGLSCIIIVPPILLSLLVPKLGAAPLQTLSSLSPEEWGSLLFLTFLGATFSMLTWNYAAGILRPSMLGAALYVIPVLSVLAGWAMLNEPVTIHIVIAASVILAGVAIAQVKLDRRSMVGLALVLFAVTMWGMVPVAMRHLLLEVSPQTAIVLRLFPAGVLAALLVVFLYVPRLSVADWTRIIIAALCGNVLYQILAAYGGQLIPASWTGVLFGLEPVFIALGAAMFAGERMNHWFFIGLLIALSGTAVLLLGGTIGSVKDVNVLGVVLVVLSTVGWAIYTIVIGPVAARRGAFATACLTLAVSAFPMLLFASPTLLTETLTLSPFDWAVVAFLAIFATVLATGAWNMALGYMESSKAGMFLYVQPIVATVGGVLLLSEEISMWLAGGGALILLGVGVSQFGSPRKIHDEENDYANHSQEIEL